MHLCTFSHYSSVQDFLVEYSVFRGDTLVSVVEPNSSFERPKLSTYLIFTFFLIIFYSMFFFCFILYTYNLCFLSL